MCGYTASRLAEGAAPATINKELAALGRMLRLAFKDGRLPARPAVPKLHVDNAPARDLWSPPMPRLCAPSSPDSVEPPIRYASLTGQRKRNVLGLLWARVAFDPDGGATVRLDPKENKTGAGQVLAFAPGSPVAELLGAQRRAAASTAHTCSTGTGEPSATSTLRGGRRA